MKAWLMKLFEHLIWADQRVLSMLEESAAARTAETLRLMSHVISAERIWLARARGEDTGGMAVWPDWSWEELLVVARETRETCVTFLEGLDAAALEKPVSYRNSSGARFEMPLIDILTHVALHGSYHRGQIANAVRRAGGEPVNTDFIVYAREMQPSRD